MRRKIRKAIARFKHEVLMLPRLSVRPDDGFVASFPRAGNTWLRYLLFEALHPEGQWDLLALEDAMPNIGRVDLAHCLRQMNGHTRRFFKTHDAFRPYFLQGKNVYLIRNGRDSLLSLYHYRRQMEQIDMPLSEFLHHTLRGDYRYGSWHTHVQSWLAHEGDPNLLILRYEDMVTDTVTQLDRVFTFLGFSFTRPFIEQTVSRVTPQRVDEGFRRYAQNRNHDFGASRTRVEADKRPVFSAEDEALFQDVCGDMQRKLGYV